MAATIRSQNIRDYRKERKERDWSAFFADDAPKAEETWDASVEALLTNRKVREEESDD